MRTTVTMTFLTATAASLVLGSAVPARAGALPLDVGVGLVGTLHGNFLDKTDQTHPTYQGHQVSFETYPGFGGMGYGAGLALDLRLLGMVGLEVDAIRSRDYGHGNHTVNGQEFTVEIGQNAWHLPVLAKFTAPMPVVRPFVMAGPEFVFPSTAQASVDPGDRGYPPVDAYVDNYMSWTGALGVELKLPTPGIDLRIPLSLRASYTPSVSDKLEDRSTVKISQVSSTQVHIDSISYDSTWKYQATISLGVLAYF